MILVVVIVLLIPCAKKMLGTIGNYPRQGNSIHKHLYYVNFIYLTALTSYSGGQTTNYKLQNMMCASVLVISQSDLSGIS